MNRLFFYLSISIPLLVCVIFLLLNYPVIIGPVLHLRTLLLGMLPLVVFIAPARRILDYVNHSKEDEPCYIWLYACFLAFGLASAFAFLLLTFGIAYPGVLIALSGLILLLHWNWWKSLLLVKQEHEFGSIALNGEWGVKVLSLFVVFMLVWVALLPPASEIYINYDAHEYHLRVPEVYLQSGGWTAFPYNVYAAFPMNVELIYMWPLASQSAAGCTVVNLLFAMIAAYGITLLLRRWGMNRFSGMAVLVFLSTGLVVRLIVQANIDLALAAAVVVLLVAYERFRESEQTVDLVMIIIALGFALGAKYIAVAAVLFPFLVMFSVDIVMNRNWKWFKSLMIICVFSFLVFAPWLVRNFVLYSNPVYPLFTQTFGGEPEIYAELFGAAHSAKQETLSEMLTNLLYIPLKKSFGAQSISFGFSCLWLIGLPGLLWVSWKHPLFRMGCFMLAAYIAWFFLTQRNDRFLAPILPFLAILTVYGLSRIPMDSLRRLVHIVVLGVVAVQLWVITSVVAKESTVNYLFSPTFEQEYISESMPHFRAIEWLNQQKQKNVRMGDVLFIGEAQTFGAQFNAIAPTVFNHHPLEDGLPASVTHIVYNESELRRLSNGYGPLGWPLGDRLKQWMNKAKADILDPVFDVYPQKPGLLVVYRVER